MARSFSGSGQYLSYSGSITTGTPLTMAAWVYVANVTNYYNVMSAVDYDPGHYHVLAVDGARAGDPVVATTNGSGGEVFAYSTSGYTASAWHHMAGVWAANNSRAAYLNGANKGTNASTSTPAGNLDRFTVGGYQDVSGAYNPLNGRMAEAAIWNVALTDAEIAQLAKGLSPALIRPGALVAYWPLYGRNSPEPDWAGRYPLTLTGTPGQVTHPGRIVYPVRPRLILPAADAPPASVGAPVLGRSVLASPVLGRILVH